MYPDLTPNLPIWKSTFQFFFFLSNFQVVQNIRLMDKSNIDSGVVCIGFAEPELDIVIVCNPKELKVFMHTMEVVQHLTSKCFELPLNFSSQCLCENSTVFSTCLLYTSRCV